MSSRAPSTPNRFLTLLLSLFCLSVFSVAPAQDDEFEEEEVETVQVRLPEGDFYPGEVFPFYLIIEDAGTVVPGEIPESPDFAVQYVDAVSSVKEGVKTWALTYQAVAVKGGRLHLPAMPVSVDGLELWNAPKSVLVQEPTRTKDFTLSVSLSKQDAFVGEAVVLRFEWVSRISLNGVKALQLRVPAMRDPRFQIHDPLGIDPKAEGTIGLPVAGRRVIGRYGERQEGEALISKIVFERLIVPREAGIVQIPASTLLCSYFEPKEQKFRGSRYPSYFNNDFFDRDALGEHERLLAASEPIRLRVLPLPREGRPENFSGAVGAFSVSASAEPKVVEELQPVTLRLRFRGHPFPQTLHLQSLREQSTLTSSFRIPESRSLPKVERGERIVMQTIRPLHDGVGAVPMMKFDFFDPETGRYGSASTQPIPLTVKAARAATAFEAEFSDGTKLQNEVRGSEEGLRHHRIGPEVLALQPLASRRGSAVFWTLLLGLPPLLCLLSLRWEGVRRERRENPGQVRSREAHARFRKAQASSTDGPSFHGAVVNYLCDRLGFRRGAAAPREMLRGAAEAGAKAETLEPLGRYLEMEDWSRFAQDESSGELSQERGEVLRLVDQLEKETRRPNHPGVATGSASASLWFLVCSMGLALFVAKPAAASPEETLARAEALFHEAKEIALQDPVRGKDLYAESATHYERLVREENGGNARLHTNLANTRFLQGELGESVLHYHRALLFEPGDRIAQEGLAHARKSLTDSFPLDDASLMMRLRHLMESLGAKRLRWAFALAWIAFWAGLLLIGFGRGTLGKRLAIPGAALSLFSGMTFLFWTAYERERPLAVVLASEALVRKGDGHIYDPAFPNPVHAGSEFRQLEQRGEWVHARFLNGEEGWIPKRHRALVDTSLASD